MRIIVSAIILLYSIGPVFAQSTQDQSVPAEFQDINQFQCPHTHRLDYSNDVDTSDYFLLGTVGRRTVRMHLHRGGAGVVGLFYFAEGEWTPVLLGGEWKGKTLELTTEDRGDKPTGHLSGKFMSGKFTGNLTMTNSENSEPVQLTVAPAPKFDGSGSWTNFEDPNSPLSFSYPASWKLIKEEGYARLVCPDPATLEANFGVEISAGYGSPDQPDLPRCPEGWKFGGDCRCGKKDRQDRLVACSVPERQSNRGAKILNIDFGETRMYCIDGGYIGQGEGQNRIAIFGDRWIKFEAAGEAAEFVDRIAESVRLSTSKQSARLAENTRNVPAQKSNR